MKKSKYKSEDIGQQFIAENDPNTLHTIVEKCGSLYFKLHKTDTGLFISYANSKFDDPEIYEDFVALTKKITDKFCKKNSSENSQNPNK